MGYLCRSHSVDSGLRWGRIGHARQTKALESVTLKRLHLQAEKIGLHEHHESVGDQADTDYAIYWDPEQECWQEPHEVCGYVKHREQWV